MAKATSKTASPLPMTRRRIRTIALVFLLAAAYLVVNLFRLQCLRYEHYKNKVYSQVTTSSALKAERGNIYDRNMNLLATTETVWRVFVSTRDIKKYIQKDGVPYDERIADGLSAILQVDRDGLLQKIRNSNVLDVTVKRGVKKETYDEVLRFITENHLEHLVFAEPQASRYYPNGTLFAHVLGFTGSDNQGLYGLEYRYDSDLAGKDGAYLYAKDANGNALPSEYTTYLEAEQGNSLITTLDSFVQRALESQLETIRINHDVQNRVTGVVMDVKTGGILAMATSSPFDPNFPYLLDDVSKVKLSKAGYVYGSEEYTKYKRELLEIMWSNKAISETYEPGSTFKIVTVAAGLDLGRAKMTDRFSCAGSYEVGGWRIKCHKVRGHGSGFPLSYGLQMSCNPTMMQLAERIGAADFYDYVTKFGYLQRTGIDLPSEARTIFHDPDRIGSTELATASFGQRFKVSVIAHLNAIAAIANGGASVAPHIVEKIVDTNGAALYSFSEPTAAQIVRPEVAREVAAVLEAGVSGDGGAKNAYVDGYKIAAKTGTSQKFDVLDEHGNSYLRIGSTVAFAPSDECGIAAIIVVDEPMSQVKYGSFVAAPYIAALFSEILPYLGYEPSSERETTTVGRFIDMSVDDAKRYAKEAGLSCEIIGKGTHVAAQVPEAGAQISTALSKILLYTDGEREPDILVPDCVGLTASDANHLLTDLGFNLHIKGIPLSRQTGDVKVVAQSLPSGERVPRGTVISLTVLSSEHED